MKYLAYILIFLLVGISFSSLVLVYLIGNTLYSDNIYLKENLNRDILFSAFCVFPSLLIVVGLNYYLLKKKIIKLN